MNSRAGLGDNYDPNPTHLAIRNARGCASADQTFDMLMGNVVPPRKKFIQTHAKEVENLDV
jgi:DNA gyrase subunit B